MRERVLLAAGLALPAVPTVLAFFTGGYFASAREWAGLVMWLLAATALIAGREALPRSPALLTALIGLALLAGWTAASIAWAPIAGSAYAATQIAFLYLGALVAGVLLMRVRGALEALEPIAAAGTVIVIGYGLSERLAPAILQFARSLSAQGRLEQPLTYWNAMGEVAAIGLVLCARLAGDERRPPWVRAAAAAAAAPLGTGLYISFSRGALFACCAGLIALLALAPQRAQLRALAVVVGAAVLAAGALAPLHGVTNLAGSTSTRAAQGAIALIVLALIAGGAALLTLRLVLSAPGGALRLPRHAGLLALGVVCVGLALAIAAGAKERSGVPLSGGAGRYATLQSNRYAYWKVALKAFADEPLIGVGAGGWAVWWLRYRPYPDGAQDTHSLELQTLAELGLVGVTLLAAALGAVAVAARTAHRATPARAAGPIAACVVWLAHSPLDWDWQMPAVTLIAVVLAGGLLALAQGGEESRRLQAAAPG
ncbi:MAG: O-antigen ligase family protein [Solirubrobacteraceae bacterium]